LAKINSVKGRRVWDSRGNPTVEVDIRLDNGFLGRAIAPAGASRGKREAHDLRDGGSNLQGMNVSQAIANVNGPIAQKLYGLNAEDQAGVDDALNAIDGSPLKEKLGANATVATSLAVLHAAAASDDKPLWQYVAQLYGTSPSIPLPEIQIFGGGAHAGRRVDIQDFMIMVPGAANFEEVMEVTNEIYFAAGDIMASRGSAAGVADEGGWWPLFDSNEQAIETLVAAIEKAGEKPGERVVISLDVAASEFGSKGQYQLALDDRKFSSEDFIDLLGGWLDAYPIVSIEDPLAEDDTDGMIEFTKQYGDRLQVVGDDYLVTNARLVEQSVHDGACNTVLVKPNQVGTVSEAVAAFHVAKEFGWGTIVSARSGETEDVSMVHFSAQNEWSNGTNVYVSKMSLALMHLLEAHLLRTPGGRGAARAG